MLDRAILIDTYPRGRSAEDLIVDERDQTIRQALIVTQSMPWSDQRKLYVMAAHIISEYLGQDFFEKNFIAYPGHETFFANLPFDEYSISLNYHRVLQLADSLFQIRNSRNFAVLCRRFNNKTLRASYYEARVIAMFARSGMNVEVTKEKQIRGKDFDFTARDSELTYEVEVSEFTNDRYSHKTVINKLFGKRSQFSGGLPSILFCIIPDEWASSTNLSFWLFYSTFRFFHKSKRINSVVYMWENRVVVGDREVWSSLVQVYAHPAPRHFASLEFLFSGRRLVKGWMSGDIGMRLLAEDIAEYSRREVMMNDFSFLELLP